MTAVAVAQSVGETRGFASRYGAWLTFAALTGALILIYWPSWASMLAVWNTPTYSHSYLIPLASIWLAFNKRQALETMQAAPWWKILPLLALIGIGWMTGHLAGVNALQHLTLIASQVLIVSFAFGYRIARELVFPLGFLFLAVPIGDFMVPYMMTWTAHVTIWLVQASGIPIYREGLHFILPSGAWQVVEECSGQRYLVALVPLALIFAHLSFIRIRTKLLFVACALLVAVVANWVRAYLIVMTGHLSGMALATGVDHLIYGWLFFGVIVFLLFLWGSRWQEEPVANAGLISPVTSPVRSVGPYPVVLAIVTGLIAVSFGALVADTLSGRGGNRPSLESQFGFLGLGVGSDTDTDFKIPFGGAYETVRLSDQTGAVHLWAGNFLNSTSSDEMIHTRHSLVAANRKIWRHLDSTTIALPDAGHAQELRFVGSGTDLLVWQIFVVNGRFEADPRRAKLGLAWQQLRGAGPETQAIVLWTAFRTEPSQARKRLKKTADRIVDALRQPG